jgi:hypothetical protein
MAVSLAAPLAGQGITATQRLVLVCMHLAATAVLIPAFSLTIQSRGAADNTATAVRRTVFVSGQRPAS